MKKLLSLLSVLTIIGNAIPTTIAASPYQKEEIKLENSHINYLQTNNLEKLNRSKREQEEFFLDTLGIRGDISSDGTTRFTQLANYWCGPASVEWILRQFQLNMNSELSRINNNRQHRYVNFQHYLADLMRTHNVQNINQSIGTKPENLVNVINSFINNNNLNNRRQYELTELQPVYNDYSQFYNIVSNSLRNNMPVVFGFTGVMPGELHNHDHFVVITGFSGDNSRLETIDYTYIDPGYGRFRHFNANWLDEAIRNNSGFLIHYNQRSELPETQIPSPNQTEAMEMGGCNSNIVQLDEDYCTIDLFSNNKISKREINYSSCPIINSENPLYDKEDFFQVYYVSAGHDKIKTNLSLKTALGIEKMFYENRKTDFMIYLSNLFKKMEQKDNTGWGGSILDTDHSTLVDFIYEHYSYFHNKVLELSRNKNYNTIEIETNRVGDWNPGYIYLINRK